MIQVQRTGALSSGARVDYKTEDGTAAAGKDYQAQSGTLHFASRESLPTLRIPILDDGFLKDGKWLTMKLSNPSAESPLATSNATTITIRDNGRVPPVSPDPDFSGNSILETPPPNSGIDRLAVQPDGTIQFAGGMVVSAETNRDARF